LHDAYIEKIAAKFDVNDNASIPATLMSILLLKKYDDIVFKSEIKKYQEFVGFLLYTAVMLKLDITFAIAKLLYYFINLGSDYFETGLRILKYIWGTRFLGI
jgi:hypothetical protein